MSDVSISMALADARQLAVREFLDRGNDPAKVLIYRGLRPTNGATPPGALLVEIALDKPCGSVAGGVLTLTSAALPVCVGGGSAAWARVLNGAGAHAFDCDVALDAPGASASLRLDSVDLLAGGVVRLTQALLC